MQTSFLFDLDEVRHDGWKSNRFSHEWGWDGERRATLRKYKRAHIRKDLQEIRSNDVVNAKYIFFLKKVENIEIQSSAKSDDIILIDEYVDNEVRPKIDVRHYDDSEMTCLSEPLVLFF